MHFTYIEPDFDSLHQGDILEKTSELKELINVIHPHYSKDEYTHFQVLTQSCDLVKRGGECGAKYLTIAAVRSLSTVVTREIEKTAKKQFVEVKDASICSEKHKPRLMQFLESLFNNNSKEHFFLRAEPRLDFYEDCCTFLHLSIALKPEHYDALLRAKRLQLSNVFKSKLGWMVGNLYSRVGTPDYVPSAIEEKSDFVSLLESTLDSFVVWAKKDIFPYIQKEYSDEVEAEELIEKALQDYAERIDSKVENFINAISKMGGVEVTDKSAFKKSISDNPKFRKKFSLNNLSS